MMDLNNNKGRAVLAGSVVLNIFLVAFVAGRMSMQEMLPPPPPPPSSADSMHGDRHHGHSRGGRFMDSRDRDFGHGKDFGKRDRHHGMRGEMPPPPMFGPAELLSRDEMRKDMKAMKAEFDKVRDARRDFAKKLAAGPVSKEEVLTHFKQVDGIMSKVRSETQDKLATKLSGLSDEQRERIAKRFDRHGPRHHPDSPPPPSDDMPDEAAE
jgi:uncharacterized membrane protein